MSFLTEWLTTIVLFILFAIVIDMLLPSSSMQKYAKMVVSLLLIVVMLTPIFKLSTQTLLSSLNTSQKTGSQSLLT